MLKLTELFSGKYGLRLNKDKCVAIQMNNDGVVHFENGEPLPKKFETTYLGNELNRDVNIKHEILNKMQEVRKTWYKLLPYWKATNANVKWQLLIFDAVIRSKLLYGLETVHVTGAMLKKIDAFHMRCLRRILKIPSTFIDRRYSNRVVLQRCTEILFANQGDQRQFEIFSQSYLHRKSKLLGHVFRAGPEDPMRQISFQPYSAVRPQYGRKRVGRPKQNWLHYAKKHTFEHILRGYDYLESPDEDAPIYNAAINRTF